MKNTVVIEKITKPEWNKPENEILEIMKFWLTTGVQSDINLISQIDILNLRKKLKNPRGRSEAMASYFFAQKNNTRLIYCNEKYSPINGVAHGIDLGHISNNRQLLYVIEVKLTYKNTSSNFSSAKSELLSRFDPNKPNQLNQLLNFATINKYIDVEEVKSIHFEHVKNKTENMIAFMPDSLVPTALVLSHHTISPKKDHQIFKVLYKLEPEM